MSTDTEIVQYSAKGIREANPEPACYTSGHGTGSGGSPEIGAGPGTGGIVEYWRILRRNRGTVLLFSVLGVVAAVLISLPQTPLYRARAALEIQDINNDFLNSRQVNPVAEGGNGGSLLADVQTQMKILQTENLIDRVVDKLKKDKKLDNLELETGRLSIWRKALKLSPPVASDVDYQIRQKAIKALTVRQLGQTRVVEVLYSSTDPVFAAEFTNTLAGEYINSNIEARWKMSQHTGEWLSHELDDMRVKLARSGDAVEAYARGSGLLFTSASNASVGSEKTNVVEEKLRQLQEELSKAQAERIGAQSRYELTKSASLDSLPDVLNDPSLRSLQEKLTELRRQQAELITVYTAKNEKVRRVEAQIAPLQAAFDRDRASILGRIRNDYDSALRRESLLATDYSTQAHLVTNQAEKAIQYNILKRELETNRQLYESMLQQVKQTSIASAMRASNVRVVDPAKAPRKAYSPDFMLNAGIGVISGILLGVGLVIVRDRSNQTLQQPGDIQYWLNLPELGVIPMAGNEARNPIYFISAKRSKQTSNGGGESQRPMEASANRDDVALITNQHKSSLIAEAFRALLTSILFSGESGNPPRVLVMSSPSPMEGKTTVVANLAIALAEVRRRVLVIDADLRKPRMHKLFDVPNERGLSSLLETTEIPNDGMALIQETAIPGLFVLPSGPSTHAAANLLYSSHLPALLKELRARFDMILIDTPPMLQMTDARVVGQMADAVILVSRSNQTTREAAAAACQRFSEDKTRVLGMVLNDWNPRTSPGGYYGSYSGYQYGYNGYYTALSRRA